MKSNYSADQMNPNLSYINMCYKNAVAINMGQKNEK
jgi:hypothetical protein